MADLIRPEALKHAETRLSGEVMLVNPPELRLATFAFVGAIILAFIFLGASSFPRKETVAGRIVPGAGVVRLTSDRSGLLATIYVREGQSVIAGQRLAEVRSVRMGPTGESHAMQIGDLRRQALAAADEARAQIGLLEAEAEGLPERQRFLNQEIAEVRGRLELQNRRTELAREELARAEDLAGRGFLPRREVAARQSTLVSVEQEASVLRGRVLELERDVLSLNQRRQAISLDIAAAQAGARRAQASLDQSISTVEAEAGGFIVAPVSGRVVAVPLQEGQMVQPDTALMLVAASGAPLEAELLVPSRAGGFLKVGQEVLLKYDAFPHQKYGLQSGEIASITQALVPGRDLGSEESAPMFRVKVRLTSATLSAYGERFTPAPGMLLSADIVFDRRSLFQWVLDPVFATRRS